MFIFNKKNLDKAIGKEMWGITSNGVPVSVTVRNPLFLLKENDSLLNGKRLNIINFHTWMKAKYQPLVFRHPDLKPFK